VSKTARAAAFAGRSDLSVLIGQLRRNQTGQPR